MPHDTKVPRSFWDVFESTARAVLDTSRDKMLELDKITAAMEDAERIALYPCNRYSRKLLNTLEKDHPHLFRKIIGVFDKGTNLNFRKDIPVYPLDTLNNFELDKLIVTTSKFPDDLLPDINKLDFPGSKVFVSSLFHEELSHIPTEEIINKVRKVVDILTDKKSKITYLLTWISLLLLDKDMLSIYALPEDLEYFPGGVVKYHGMELENINDPNIQYGLFLEIYKMEYVAPEPGDILLDIGAYRGDTVALFRKYLGDTGRIYAFEPDEQNYQYLVSNVTRNRMDNVIPVKKGLLDHDATANLISTPSSSSFLFVMKNELDTDAVTEIQATTVDSFVRDNGLERVDFIKSDIEGCEMEMLSGARDTIQRCKPKMAIAIYHSITDLLNIPLQVHALNQDYEFYIRHRNFIGSPWEILMFTRPVREEPR